MSLGDRRVIFALNSGESNITSRPDFTHGDIIAAHILNPGPTSNLTIDQTITSSSTTNNVPSSLATYNYGQSIKPTTVTVVNSSSTDSTLPTSKAVYDYGQTIKESTQSELRLNKLRFVNPHYDCSVGLAVWDKLGCMPATCWPFTIQDNDLGYWNTDNLMLRGNFMLDLAYPKVGTTPSQYISRTNFPQRRYVRSLFNIEPLNVMSNSSATIDDCSGVYTNGSTLVLRRYKVYPQTVRKFQYTTQSVPTTFGGDFPWDCCVIDAYDFDLDLVMRAPHFSPEAYGYSDYCCTSSEIGKFNSVNSHLYRNPAGGYSTTPTTDVSYTIEDPKVHVNIPNWFIGGIPTSVHPSGLALVRLPGFTEYLQFKDASNNVISVDSMYTGYYSSSYSKVPVTGRIVTYDRPNNVIRESELTGLFDPWVSWSATARTAASPNTQLNCTRLYLVSPADLYSSTTSRLFLSNPNHYTSSWTQTNFTGVGTIFKELRMKWNFVKQ